MPEDTPQNQAPEQVQRDQIGTRLEALKTRYLETHQQENHAFVAELDSLINDVNTVGTIPS